jgi:hypothetical protein
MSRQPTTRYAPDGTLAAGARRRIDTWLVPVLDALLEGAWLAVVDGLLAAWAGTRALGPLPFAAFALASLVLARSSPDRQTTAIGLAVLYVVAVIFGGFLGAGGTGSGLILGLSQSAAVLSAVAVFRGSRHVDQKEDDLVVGTILEWGIPLLAVPWLVGLALTPAARAAFVAVAFPSTLVFVTAGLFALGLSRLDALSASSGLDWRRNRPWLVMLVAVLAVMTLIAVPASFLLGAPITSVLGGLLGPLAIVLSPFAEAARQILTFLLGFLDPLVAFLRSLMQAHPPPVLDTPSGPFGSLPPRPPDSAGDGSPVGTILVVLFLLAVALIALIVVVRLTMQRQVPAAALPDQPFEEREYRLPGLSLHLPRFSRPRRRPDPTTASEAYLGFLAALDGRPELARRPSEPPASHAARLREAGFTDLRAGLLAADYELERYALRDLPARETARALRRWQALRQLLRS